MGCAIGYAQASWEALTNLASMSGLDLMVSFVAMRLSPYPGRPMSENE